MRLARVSVQAFRGFRSAATLDLEPGLTVLVGANGSGKSSLLNAIEWCLYGREVEKTASGIAERRDWEVANRSASDADTVVRLTWDHEDGRVQVTRLRPANAKRTAADSVTVETPGGEVLSGARAADWLRVRGFPSWTEWRSSYCQHQEAARDRLITKENRTKALVALLGLEDVATLKARLDGLKLTSARRSLKEADARIEADLELLQSASTDLEEARASLQDRGLDPEAVTRRALLDAVEDLHRRAILLEGRLGVPASPDLLSADLDQAISWADAWAGRTRRHPSSTLSSLGDLRHRAGELEATLASIEPLEASLAAARSELAAAEHAGGDEQARRRAVDEARQRLARVEEERRRSSRLAALLQDARELTAPEDRECPVCRSEVEGVHQVVTSRLEEVAGAAAEQLERAAARAEEQLRDARQALARLEELRRQVQTAEDALRSRSRRLKSMVADDTPDVVAAARREHERLTATIADLSRLEDDLDAHLAHHRAVVDDVHAMSRYLAALDREDRHVDVEVLPAWDAYNAARDALAALVGDCEALAVMAKDELAELSETRLEEVNRTLGEYVSLIGGGGASARRGITVVSHSTPKMLDYRIVDDGGDELVPILNQAALNAISMAMLFAQAEARAGAGPTLLVLDDPEQSLDDDHVAGLVRALDRAARHRDVLVGTTPSRLADRLGSHATARKRFCRLAEWSPDRGATLEAGS